MRSLFSYLKPYRFKSIASPALKCLEAILELFIPLLIASLIDKGILQNNTKHMLSTIILLFILGVICFSVSLLAQYFAAQASVGAATDIRKDLFAHIQTWNYSQLDAQSASTLINRLTTDVLQIQTGLNMAMRLLLRSPFIVLGSLVMAIVIAPNMSFYFIILITLLTILILVIMYLSLPKQKKVQNQLDNLMQQTEENITGVRVLRAFTMEDEEQKQFFNKTKLLYKLQIAVGKILAWQSPMSLFFVNGILIVLLLSGSIKVNDGILSTGEVVALVNLLLQILTELLKLANLIVIITKGIASGKRVSAILNTNFTNENGNEQPLSPIPIILDNVSFTYPQDSISAISNISFTAKKGETIGILGGTGCGKSTLLLLIANFYKSTEGSILFNNHNINNLSSSYLREHIAIVPQKTTLIHASIKDNIKWGNLNATDEEVVNALTLAQGLDIIKSKKDGLETIIAPQGKNLSGGQKQRITIARALVKNADILLLDDCASALDYATDKALRHALSTIANKPTIFITAQRVSAVQNCDKIIVMDEGKIVAEGTHKSLLKDCAIYKETYQLQFPLEDGV